MSRQRAKTAAMHAGDRPLPGFDRTLGFELIGLEHGRAVFETDAGVEHHNPADRVHGGFLAGLADSAMGFAYGSTLDEGQACTNVDVSIRYLRPVWTGRLRAEGRVVKRGRTTGLAEADVTDATGRLIARATSTFLTMPESEIDDRTRRRERENE